VSVQTLCNRIPERRCQGLDRNKHVPSVEIVGQSRLAPDTDTLNDSAKLWGASLTITAIRGHVGLIRYDFIALFLGSLMFWDNGGHSCHAFPISETLLYIVTCRTRKIDKGASCSKQP
jgi:hypothetical protein